MFEFFLKYPRSVYERGQFALLGAWPKWLLVVLILAAVSIFVLSLLASLLPARRAAAVEPVQALRME